MHPDCGSRNAAQWKNTDLIMSEKCHQILDKYADRFK